MFEMWQFSFLLSFELDFMTRVSCCNANVQVCPRSNGKVWGSSKLEITQVAGEPTGIEVWDAGKANEWRCDSDSVDWAGTDPEILVMPWSKCCCACWHNRRPGRANGSLRCGSAGRRWCAVPAVRDRSAWRWNGRTTFLDECLCPLCHIWPFQKISPKKKKKKSEKLAMGAAGWSCLSPLDVRWHPISRSFWGLMDSDWHWMQLIDCQLWPKSFCDSWLDKLTFGNRWSASNKLINIPLLPCRIISQRLDQQLGHWPRDVSRSMASTKIQRNSGGSFAYVDRWRTTCQSVIRLAAISSSTLTLSVRVTLNKMKTFSNLVTMSWNNLRERIANLTPPPSLTKISRTGKIETLRPWIRGFVVNLRLSQVGQLLEGHRLTSASMNFVNWGPALSQWSSSVSCGHWSRFCCNVVSPNPSEFGQKVGRSKSLAD